MNQARVVRPGARQGGRVCGIVLLLTVMLVPQGHLVPWAPSPLAYMEPGLSAQGVEPLSVIVTALDAQAAARAVERLGGRVTSNLWLIDAVAATIPAQQVPALAAQAGVLAVVANKRVKAAGEPYWDGYVTDIRVLKPGSPLDLASTQDNPVTYLPDGAYVSVDRKGNVRIVDGDGTIRAAVTLAGDPFSTPTVVGSDGAIYLAGEAMRVHALNADGSTRWEFAPAAGKAKFLGGVALGPNGTVYAADSGGTIYALDPLDGNLDWQFQADTVGKVKATPAVGLDGTVYLATDKGYAYAVNPARGLQWSYETGGKPGLSPLVRRPAGDRVYVVDLGGKSLFALDAATGQLAYEFKAGSDIDANPAVGADGSVYLAAGSGLYGINLDGSQRFYFPVDGSARTSPVLAADGKTVYLAAYDRPNLFALDAVTGEQRWVYVGTGKFQAGPVLNARGEVVIGSSAKNLEIVGPDGKLASLKALDGKITQAASISPQGDITVRVGNSSLTTVGLPPHPWDGTKDVIEVPKCEWPTHITSACDEWRLVYPVAIDVGADRVHETALAGTQPVDGRGVVVAVLDTGTYFDPYLMKKIGTRVGEVLDGQADFVDPLCGTSGVQHNNPDGTPAYCFREGGETRDEYGHGTHVSGIINAPFRDANTGVSMSIAPGAKVLSVRVLGLKDSAGKPTGAGTYETVIEGIQYVVENRAAYNIRVLNLSLSATPTTPYFADPLNRAVEAAWAAGIVVVTAAGNAGPGAETIAVPGNDPYVITVGAVNGQRTPGYWADDVLPGFSATGPTADGYVKPDVLVPGMQVISFMYRDPHATPDADNSQALAREHPDYSENASLFRMSGTSMAAAVTSGVVALMLQAHPELTPDQVKYRLMFSARPAMTSVDEAAVPVYNIFQQGAGRVWAPAAVFGEFPADRWVNAGMDVDADLGHDFWQSWSDSNGNGLVDEAEIDPQALSYHYQGVLCSVC